MRTTIILEDDLFTIAKKRAIELHVSMSALIGQALRESLRPARPQKSMVFRMPTFGASKLLQHSSEDLKNLLDEP